MGVIMLAIVRAPYGAKLSTGTTQPSKSPMFSFANHYFEMPLLTIGHHPKRKQFFSWLITLNS